CFGLDALWERRAGRVEREYVRRLIAVGLLAGVATLLTPYHLRLYDEVWTYTGQATIYPLIQELQPFALDSELAWLALGGALASAAVLSRGRVRSPLALGLYALALAFTLRMRRDVWLLAVVSACVVAGFGRPGARGPRGYSLTPRLLGAALGTFLLGAVASFPLAGATPAALDDAVAARYPVAAAAHVREHAYPGPLYNHFDQGGYLIWALPGYPVAMDGRTNVHGAARVARAAESWRALPGWDADPELLAAGVVIAPLAQPLTARLREDPRFRAVFEGPVSAVFVRR
ncbi:MAG: hypothetical protein KDD82_16050, partial [Planctomycetes bacterium]|nr:hypothetical protein [Planctomycetota bacterium]